MADSLHLVALPVPMLRQVSKVGVSSRPNVHIQKRRDSFFDPLLGTLFGSLLDHFGTLLGHFGTFLGPLGLPFDALGLAWAPFWTHWGSLGTLLGSFWLAWAPIGTLLGPLGSLGCLWDSFCSLLGSPWTLF